MPTDALQFIAQLATQAGSLLAERFHLSGTHADLKADRSFVTESDLASDRLIGAAIRQAFPQDHILSEEKDTSSAAGAPAVWVIDPLDGTTNYAVGMHVWGVSIARLEQGIPTLAALYFPLLDELYTAQRGAGAWLNGAPIHTRPPDETQPLSFFVCCSRTHRRYKVSIPYKARILGSSAYSYCMLARGAALIAFEATPKVWDLAGGWLVVQEAGGVIETLFAPPPFPLSPETDYARSSFPTLAAATPDLLAQSRQQIQPR